MPVQPLNDTVLALGFVANRVRPGAFDLTTIVKGRFRILASQRSVPLERPLLAGDVFTDDDAPSSLRYASDFAPFKPHADITMVGTCHAPAGKKLLRQRVTFGLGTFTKALVVHGDRHYVTGPNGQWVPSEPLPFETMPLQWERAFGGEGFAPNPIGLGYAHAANTEGEEELASAGRVPNLELLGTPILSRDERPEPASFGPIPLQWAVRSSKAATYDAAWLAKDWPYLPADFDWSTFNAATRDQRVGYLRGDETLTLEGVHPEYPKLESSLPGLRPRCFFRQRIGDEEVIVEAALRLDTAHVDADTMELVLVWRGLLPISTRDADEVTQALLVVEALSEPALPRETYVEHRSWTPLAAADEGLQQPEAPPPAPRGPAAGPKPELDPGEQEVLRAARADLEKVGADPALLARLEGVTSSTAFVSIVLAAMAPSDEAGIATATVAAANENAGDAPPATPGLSERRKEARALMAAELEEERKNLVKAGADPALLKKLESEDTRYGFLRVCIGAMPPPQSPAEQTQRDELMRSIGEAERVAHDTELAEEAAERAPRGERLSKEEVLAMLATGGSLAGANLTGLDLTGVDFRAANLTETKLDRAILVGALLAKTDLTRASLRFANLRGAILDEAVASGVDMSGANLAEASLRGAVLSNAHLGDTDFSNARLERAELTAVELTGAKLAGAVLDGAALNDALLTRVNLEGASLVKASLRNVTLAEANLVRATLTCAILNGSSLSGAQFDEANLSEAHLEGATGEGVSFVGAKLVNLRAAGITLAQARLAGCDASGSNWSRAELTSADFTEATLTKANLSEASVARATFHRAKLDESNFAKANLTMARLTKVNGFRARFAGARLTAADCRSSNFFECDFFEAVTDQTMFDGAILDRTILALRRPS